VNRPAVVVVLPLEGEPALRIFADSAEDETRLVSWLRRSRSARKAVIDALERFNAEERAA
jgi:hypothetical protein